MRFVRSMGLAFVVESLDPCLGGMSCRFSLKVIQCQLHRTCGYLFRSQLRESEKNNFFINTKWSM